MKFGTLVGNEVETISANTLVLTVSELQALKKIETPGWYQIGATKVLLHGSDSNPGVNAVKHKPVESK